MSMVSGMGRENGDDWWEGTTGKDEEEGEG